MSIRALVWGLVAGAALALAGCGAGATGEENAGGEKTAGGGEKLKIGISIPAATHGWTAGVNYWAEDEMKKHPDVEWVLETCNNVNEQIADIETMMAQNIDALVILAFESQGVTPVVGQARERGIYIVNVDRGLTEPFAHVYLQGDNKLFGKLSAEFMVEKLGGKGNIVILEGIASTVNTDRVDAAMEVFKQHPDIKILGQQAGEWNRDKALSVMQTFLVQHPKIDAVWAQDDDMALGVEQAIREAGRDGEMWILGGAGMKDIVKRVMDKDPVFPANITYPPSMIAQGIARAVEDLTAGKHNDAAEKETELVVIPVELVTPENADKFYFPDSPY